MTAPRFPDDRDDRDDPDGPDDSDDPAERSTVASAGPAPQVAPFVLVRVAGFPYDRLADLAPTEGVTLVARVRSAVRAAESTRGRLEDALFEIVPTLGRAERADILAVRRAVHSASRLATSPTAVTAEQFRTTREALGSEDRANLDLWWRSVRLTGSLVAGAEADEVESRRQARAALRALVGREQLRRPLALSAPGVLLALGREAEAGRPVDERRAARLDRALVGYVMRGSTKTSPLSTFMHIGLLHRDYHWGSSAERAGPTALAAELPELDRPRTSMCFVSRGYLSAVQEAVHGCCGDRGHALVLPATTVTWTGGGAHAWRPVHGWLGTRRLRLPVRSWMPAAPGLQALLGHLPPELRWAELVELLTAAGCPAEQADELVEHLVDGGLLTLASWTDGVSRTRREPAPLASCPSRAAEHVRRHLSGLHHAAARMPRLDAAARLALTAELHSAAAELPRVKGFVARAPFPIQESGYFRAPLGPHGSLIGELVEEVARVLAQRVHEHPDHLLVRERFVAEYGEGGRCYEVGRFLGEVAAAAAGSSPGRAVAKPRATMADRPLAATTVLVQVDVERDGSPVAVLNSVHSGAGWMAARHLMGSDEFHAGLADQLRSWLKRVAAPAEPVDLLVGGDLNDLQAHPRLTERVLVPPLEPGPAGCLTWNDLVLHDDPDQGVLVLSTGGARIAPTYLGGTVPNRMWGAVYWMTVIARPWVCAPVARPAPPADVSSSAIVFHESVRSGRVVLRRAGWWVPVKRVRETWLVHSGLRRCIDLAAEVERLGIADQFYLTPGARLGQGSKPRKPFLVDIRNPLSVACLDSLVAGATHVYLTEPQPGRPAWPLLDGVPHAAELHAEVLV